MGQSTAIDIAAQPKTFREEIRMTLKLGWPIILSNLAQILLPIVDGIMVGSIHSHQLAAASLVTNIMVIPVILCMGLPMAVSPLVAAALGRSDEEQPSKILFNGLLVGGIFSLVLAVIFHLGSGLIFYLGQGREVAEIAREYLVLMGWRILPLGIFVILTQFSGGIGFTKIIMILSFISVPLNIALNYIFIFGHLGFPAMNLSGAGYGTLLTQLITLVLFILIFLRHQVYEKYRRNFFDACTVDKVLINQIFKIGVPTGLLFAMESGAFAFSGIMSGWLGPQEQAAHQIGLYISSLTLMIPMGICAAGTIRIGFNFGKKDWAAVYAIGRSTLLLAFAVSACFSIILFLGKSHISSVFVNEFEVLELAKVVLMLVAIFQISDAIQSTSSGILRGIQDVKVPTYLSLIAFWLIGIPVAYFFGIYFNWGISGLWIGLVIGLTVNALLLSSRFFRKVKLESQLASLKV